MLSRPLFATLLLSCFLTAACDDPPVPEVCDDGTDNDGDGDTDCADSSCAAAPACNVALVARDDEATATEDVALDLAAADLLANDDGSGMLEITAVDSPVNGAVTLSGSTITFTPAAELSGAASFVYTVEAGGESSTATVRLTVTAVDDPPVAADDGVAMVEDTVRILDGGDLFGNDVDVDSDVLTLTAVDSPVNGTAVLAGGNISFTPPADFTGTASFDYTVSDGTSSDTATVTITVIGEGDPALIMADTATTDEDTALDIPAATLLGNDSDPDGGLTVESVQGAVNGSVVLVDTTVTFTPAANFAGTASFTYTAGDGSDSGTATVTVTVTAVDDPPVAGDDAATTDEDANLTIPLAILLGNDADPDDVESITSVQDAVNGSVSIVGTDVVFDPDPELSGAASFTYTLTGGALTDTGAVAVTVTLVDDPPIAGDDAASTAEDTAVTIPMATLLGNDSDVDDVESITSVQDGVNGTAAISGTDVIFTPTAELSGTASFQYTLTGGSLTDTATVTVTVTPVEDCLDGAPDPGEECDDGNLVDGDGCEDDCTFTCASGSGADAVVVDATTGHCYASFDGDAVTWAAAEAFCEGLAGYLPVVGDAAENTLVGGMTVGSDNPWLGGFDPQDDSTFQWVNGDAFVFQPWASAQPDDGFGNEDCIHLWLDAPGGAGWNDTNCAFAGFVTGVVCEIEASPCGDGVFQAAIGEACDDGNNANDDGCGASCQLEPRLVINEVDYDQIGTDSAEFIEIFNAGPGTADLSDYAVVAVNGSTTLQYRRFDLSTSGAATLPPDSYLLIANGSVNPTFTPRISFLTDSFQNGAPDGIGVFRISDGVLLDALSYEGNLTTAVTDFGTVSFVEGAATPLADSNTIEGSLSRSPNGSDGNNALTDWAFAGTPTPGASN